VKGTARRDFEPVTRLSDYYLMRVKMANVIVVIGAGSIGQAIREVGNRW